MIVIFIFRFRKCQRRSRVANGLADESALPIQRVRQSVGLGHQIVALRREQIRFAEFLDERDLVERQHQQFEGDVQNCDCRQAVAGRRQHQSGNSESGFDQPAAGTAAARPARRQSGLVVELFGDDLPAAATDVPADARNLDNGAGHQFGRFAQIRSESVERRCAW